MGEFVSDDDVVRYTAVAALSCGQFVIVPDGRVGVVQNMKGVAIGDVATVKVRGIVSVLAAEAISAGNDVGIHIANQTALKAGASGTTRAGKCLYDCADAAYAQVDLGVFNGKGEAIASASTAAAGSTTADAGVLPAATGAVYITSAADGTKGVRVHADDKVTERRLYIVNPVAAVLKVYPPSGGTINAGAADAAFSSASGKGVILICTSASANTWAGF